MILRPYGSKGIAKAAQRCLGRNNERKLESKGTIGLHG